MLTVVFRAVQCIEPPEEAAVATSVARLKGLGALTKAGELTPLGRHLALLPIDVQLGKVLIYGTILRCIDPILTVAAGMSGRSPFRAPMDKRGEADARKQALKWANSDHLTLVRVYNEWRSLHGSAQRSYAQQNFISYDTMRTIGDLRKDYAAVLADIGFLPGRGGFRSSSGGHHGELLPEFNACAEKPTVLQAALVAGLAPNLLKIKRPAKFADVMGSSMQVCAGVWGVRWCVEAWW